MSVIKVYIIKIIPHIQVIKYFIELMLHNLRQFRRCIITLTILTFLFGFGGNSAQCYCFIPDGNVYLGQNHSVCGIDGEHPFNDEAVSLDYDRALSQGHCVHIILERDTTDHLHRNLIRLPVTASIPLGTPTIPAQTEKLSFRNIPAVIPPLQLVSLQSVILLI